MTSEQGLQVPGIVISEPGSELPPIEEAGWFFSVAPPARCNVGPLPYPLIFKGPIPTGGLSADQKTWEGRTTLYRLSDTEGWKEVKVFSRTEDGLGPLATQRVVVGEIYMEEPGLYKIEFLVSLHDETQGKVIRRVRARSAPFNVEAGYNNASIRRTLREDREVAKILQRIPQLEDNFVGYLDAPGVGLLQLATLARSNEP
ncbi:hypothetical protein TMatcc_004938 [Talaromyces marneffei ATCC 18224]|uniref:Uncharacterized protein n=2 Tax=Talaromyces marneffei TaxID=37727 RepID=B6Q1B0_TALMQ|nr:uncharacterized protein EYB26_000144 [Talaromyces marneffei]EEA26773.1 hypothetical protein PMAA_016920 [Talaromyces marneffei ATCC 18224]KAE8557484.1 hypothetical protein EYB25_002191 [Talaromyces marneffei]QGA12500.1 hypothetical protein EYB26_000144 [Talaromyces marneffei]